jgi:HAD superfamily hydrolase (TIGR01459 family)
MPHGSAPDMQHSAPPIVIGAKALLERYDVLLCDVWGVLHDGVRAYASATGALQHFRKRGGTVVLVTNAPVPAHRVQHMLDARRVPRDAYDAIVSSGEIALAHVEAQGYARAHYVGPAERDAAFFERSAALPATVEEAEAIVCTGLVDDLTDTVETYRPLLTAARARGLPFVCANPDLVVDVGGRLYLCAGALADAYQNMGGEVFWAGKPHRIAYATAQAEARRIRDAETPPARMLVIGDSVRTDLAGARTMGLDALFVAAGIHRDETMSGNLIDADKLARLFPSGTPGAVAATAVLAW